MNTEPEKRNGTEDTEKYGREKMKKKAKTRKRMLAALCVGFVLTLAGLLLSAAAFAAAGFEITSLDTVNYTESTYDVTEPFDRIEICGMSADVRIVRAEDGVCHIKAKREENIFCDVDVSDRTLTVSWFDRRAWYEQFGISFGWKQAKLTVYLPEKDYASVKVSPFGDIEISDAFRFDRAMLSSESGDILLDSVEIADTLNASSVSGNVALKDVIADTLNASSISGSVALNDVGCGGVLFIETTSGDTRLNRTTAESIRCKTVSGSIAFSESDAQTLSLETVSGDVTGSLRSGKRFVTHTASGSVDVPRTTGGLCEITTVSGSIRLAAALEETPE